MSRRRVGFWVVAVAAALAGLAMVGLFIWSAVLFWIGTRPCDPDELCEGWGVFLSVLAGGAGLAAATVFVVLVVIAVILSRPLRSVPVVFGRPSGSEGL